MKGKLWAIALSFLVIVILLFMGLYFRVEDKLFPQPKLRFTIRFADATGVHTESKVFLLGIPAGKVDSLDYNPDNRYPKLPVSVQVSITRDIKIPRSVHASLQPTLLGESSIELALPEGEITSVPLKNGDEVDGVRLTNMNTVIPGFDNLLKQLIDFSQTLSKIASERDQNNKTQLEELVQSLNSVGASLNQPGGNSLASEFSATITNLRQASDNIRSLVDLQSKRDGTAGEVLLELQKTVEQLQKDAIAADSVLNKIALASDSVSRTGDNVNILIKESTKELGKTDPIVDRLKQIVDEFYSRPSHFLLTTRKPEEQSKTPARH